VTVEDNIEAIVRKSVKSVKTAIRNKIEILNRNVKTLNEKK
ncbi:22750_t:CDS:1, partial [Cetraspora pellucida]